MARPGEPEPRSICSKLVLRLAEDKNSSTFSPFCWTVTRFRGEKVCLCNPGRVYHAPPSLPQGRDIVS